MPIWVEWLIPFTPFVLVAALLLIRLKAAGATSQEAVKVIAVVIGLVAMALASIKLIAEGWKASQPKLTIAGFVAAITLFIALRFFLHRTWKRFSLSGGDGNEPQS